MLLIILFLNLKIYFYDYSNKKNAYYNWIEPNSSIALYISNSQNENIYILPNPHTYSRHPIISVLTYEKKSAKEIKSNKDIEALSKERSNFEIIIPLEPKKAAESTQNLEAFLLQKFSDEGFKKTYYWGIPCKNCSTTPLFMTITKTY
jgi:hypothetical protein